MPEGSNVHLCREGSGYGEITAMGVLQKGSPKT